MQAKQAESFTQLFLTTPTPEKLRDMVKPMSDSTVKKKVRLCQ